MLEQDLSQPRQIWHRVTLQTGINYVRRIIFIRANQFDIDLNLQDIDFLIEGLMNARDKLQKAIAEDTSNTAVVEKKVAGSWLSRLEKESREKQILTQSGD